MDEDQIDVVRCGLAIGLEIDDSSSSSLAVKKSIERICTFKRDAIVRVELSVNATVKIVGLAVTIGEFVKLRRTRGQIFVRHARHSSSFNRIQRCSDLPFLPVVVFSGHCGDRSAARS